MRGELKDSDGDTWIFDNIHTRGWLEGHIPGLEAGQKWLMHRAVALFEAGKDGEAVALRALALEMMKALEPRFRQAILDHKRDFPRCAVLEVEEGNAGR